MEEKRVTEPSTNRNGKQGVIPLRLQRAPEVGPELLTGAQALRAFPELRYKQRLWSLDLKVRFYEGRRLYDPEEIAQALRAVSFGHFLLDDLLRAVA